MILKKLNQRCLLAGNFFYFAADSKYFDLYGKALSLSLLRHASWSKIHVHLYNPTDLQKEWCNLKNISFTEEELDEQHPEFKTLCACIRFLRIPEIFHDDSRIISFDCDVIANNYIPKEKFLLDTNSSGITIRKGGKSLASTIAFGPDNFRYLYRNKLIEEFEKENIYWFLDQDILDKLHSESPLRSVSLDWTSTKMTPDRMIWTAKGDRKNDKIQYVNLLKYYNSLS